MENERPLSAEDVIARLRQFRGADETEQVEAYPTLYLSQGVAWLCQETGCHWLMDMIYSFQQLPQIAREPFQVIDLAVDPEKHTGRVQVGDGNDNIVFSQDLRYTDFPLAKLRLYFSNRVVYLPQEH